MPLPPPQVVQGLEHSSVPVIPKIGEQLSQVVTKGKVAVAGFCFAFGCFVNFSSPAIATDLSDLSANAELSHDMRNSIFLSERPENKILDRTGFTGSWWVAKGVYNADDSMNYGTLRFGFKGTGSNFSVYLKNAFRYRDIGGIDDIAIKMRGYGGGNILLMKNAEGELSYGYLDTKLYVSKKLVFEALRSYLLHYYKGAVQIATAGYEYFDTAPKGLENIDELRGYYVSLYRGSISHTFNPQDGIEVKLKFNSSLGLGEIGDINIGEIRLIELEDFADGNDLNHVLFHRGGASINLNLGDRVSLGFGASHDSTIGGQIEMLDDNDGEFTVGLTSLKITFDIGLFPEYGISIVGSNDWRRQEVDATMDNQSFSNVEDAIITRFVLKKDW